MKWARDERHPTHGFFLAVGSVTTSIVGTHTLAALLRHLGSTDTPLAAEALTVAASFVGIVVAFFSGRAALAGTVSGAVGALVVRFAFGAGWLPVLALPLAGHLLGLGVTRLGVRAPKGFEPTALRRRGLALAWVFLSIVSVVQVGRLATYMADPTFEFVLLTRNPFWYGHDCLGAYLYGAEMAERGEPNLYHASHYPALDPEAAPMTRLVGMRVEDPYQYPPQFLLLPLAGLRFFRDFATIRTVWFGLQFFAFLAIYVGLASWIGGRVGRIVLLSLPPLLGAFPFLFTFQYGQFHLMAVALALAAMVAFGVERTGLGGFLLAMAILAKVFPAVLLIPLALEKRARALGATVAWGAAITLLAFATLGPAPFEAFVEYQLPRLSDGAAFAFDEAWPEAAPAVVADNQGAFGFAMKLGLDKPAARIVNKAFGLAVLALIAFAAYRFGAASRWARSTMWLASLGLASLASPGAWGDYVPTTVFWLVALLVPLALARPRWAPPLVAVAVLQYFVLGTMPIGDWFPLGIFVPLSAVGAAAMMGLFTTALLSKPSILASAHGVEDERDDASASEAGRAA